jgi:hypothetical protein
MPSAVIGSLIVTSQQVYIYLGIPILILGLIGDCLNTIVFLSLKTFRQSSCAFYLTIMSVVNIGQLITGLLSRIMISGFNIDWTQTSLFYCKIRTYIFQTTSLVSLACICLATIDQYFATCTRPRWQQWSNIKTACRILTIIIFLLIIEQTPCLIYYDHMPSSTLGSMICTIENSFVIQFNVYINYLLLGSIIPYIITFSFGIMAYRNVQQLAHRTIPLVRRELDKQLTVIVLVQVIYNFFSLLPNFIVYLIGAYGNIQDPVIEARVNLAYCLTLCLYYSYFGVSFNLLD